MVHQPKSFVTRSGRRTNSKTLHYLSHTVLVLAFIITVSTFFGFLVYVVAWLMVKTLLTPTA